MKIIDAVSAVIVCKDEVFMIKRQGYLRAFPGYHAFPGGKVDKEDYDEFFNDKMFESYPTHLMAALIREVKEELEFNIEEGVKEGNVLQLKELGMALTPDFNPYRFATYFFLIELKNKPTFNVDVNEAESFFWERPQHFVDVFDKGRMLVVPPIIKLLRIMCRDFTNKKKESFDFVYDKEKEVPCIESIKGIHQMMPLSNTVPPATRTNCFLIGDDGERKLLVDPSPKNRDELSKFLEVARKLNPSDIFLTHHHGDHHQFSPEIAKHLNLNMMMGEDTYERISKKRGADYFGTATVKIIKDGDIVTKWLGEEVEVFAVPGHDEGQLALAPKSLVWFIVGDLIQGIGTVVVGGDEGDMTKYCQSLKKVLKLNPDIIIPSHGIAMGSTYRLKKTLEHRIYREEQILKLYKKGKDREGILKTIYHDIDERLFPYALANIDSHLKKLEDEGRL